METMQRLISLNEFEREWRTALALTGPTSCSNLQQQYPGSVLPDGDGEHAEDPFDCRSLMIAPTYTLINEVVAQFEEEWRELDERKIIVNSNVESFAPHASHTTEHQPTDKQAPDEDETSRPTKMARSQEKLPKWFTNRVRLPEQFDYASKRSSPPPDDGLGDRVISLLDPTQTLSYHAELWELFNSIPTAREIEATATRNVKLPHMQALSERMGLQGTKPTPESVSALAPLRYKDRHDPIPVAPPRTLGPSEAIDLVPTIQFECWRRQLKRGVSPE